ncbi:MAG: DUF1549 domain-containing protein, partial [Planctomycetes bacterium]|nr:DUF1549 domain-containing protein [Planctomycetota bacterium]
MVAGWVPGGPGRVLVVPCPHTPRLAFGDSDDILLGGEGPGCSRRFKAKTVVVGFPFAPLQFPRRSCENLLVIPKLRSLRLPLLLVALVGSASAQVRAAPVDAPLGEVTFHRDIRPILAEACYACHGPDPASRKAKLRFDREEDLFAPREHGLVVARGKPQDSLLYQRITTADQDEVMPPPDAHVQLKPAQKELLRRWIEQGAPWQKHWAFLAPERPVAPKVANAAWARNPIDGFVLAGIEAAGLQPTAEADRRTLARRLSLDLTGLPPAPDEVEAFVA